jgi:hypothetical protein
MGDTMPPQHRFSRTRSALEHEIRGKRWRCA